MTTKANDYEDLLSMFDSIEQQMVNPGKEVAPGIVPTGRSMRFPLSDGAILTVSWKVSRYCTVKPRKKVAT
jgi:hypothetical protein